MEKFNWDTRALLDEGHKQLVTDEMVDRYCVLGSTQACVDKLKELEKISVSRFCAYLFGGDMDAIDQQLRRYAEKIMPHFG